MKSQHPSSVRARLQPYFSIAFAGLLGFAPVSFMLKALKNDIVAIEYPINYFISQSLHHGQIPYWFNTWGLGFPLQSNLSWGIFSTPQLFFSGLFDYSIYTLHLEFLFFVVLAGWSMYFLLKTQFVKDRRTAQILAIGYMLSGFVVGSSQWLLYISAAAIIPLVLYAFLQLLKYPNLRNAFLFAMLYTVMFTSIYTAFSIITTYGLVIYLAVFFFRSPLRKKNKWLVLRMVGVGGFAGVVLCLPVLYYTLELLPYLDRGSALSTDSVFFNSNYLHPLSLSSLLLPLSNVRTSFPNTEGTMMDAYMGLFALLALPLALRQTIKEKNRPAAITFCIAILFLVIAFGQFTFFRGALNALPGFAYFRNPGLFRLFFILTLTIYLAMQFRRKGWEEIFSENGKTSSPLIRYTLVALMILCALAIFFNIGAMHGFKISPVNDLIKNISPGQSIFINASVQLLFLFLIFLTINMKKYRLARQFMAGELIINALLCIPYFTVGSYSPSEVSAILRSKGGFPLQEKTLLEAPATFTDSKQNVWKNVNVFNKEVSARGSYRGPLTLKQFSILDTGVIQSNPEFDHKVLFARTDPERNQIRVLEQKPNEFKAELTFNSVDSVTFLQNYYPGWSAFYNSSPLKINGVQNSGMMVSVPAGSGIIEFKYERSPIWISAVILHLLIICFFVWKLYDLIRKMIPGGVRF